VRRLGRAIGVALAAAGLLLAGCGAAKGAATTAQTGTQATAGGNLPIPAGTTAQAQLSALKGCKPTPQPAGQEYWLVTAGTGNPTYNLPKETPKIGTSLASWPTTPMVVLGNCQNTEAWVYTAGDSKNFYLAVQVDSTLPVVAGTATSPWTGDCLQFAFDPLDQMTSGSYGPNDDESGMILLNGQPFLFQNVQAGAAITPTAIPGGQASITRNNGITLYEAAIPWGTINSTVNPTFGFNIAVAAGGPPYQAPNWGYEWTQGIIEGKSPADFAQLTFKQ